MTASLSLLLYTPVGNIISQDRPSQGHHIIVPAHQRRWLSGSGLMHEIAMGLHKFWINEHNSS